MKTSDYIVEYLIGKGITDVFGYPGGMVTHFMDSLGKYQDSIAAHTSYNEQGAAIAACGYAQTTDKVGVAYATSGPGATNLITGICNAYMDSIPTLFITGQVNSFEQKGSLKVRQRGFQETEIVSIVSSITKYAVTINSANEIKYCLDKAFFLAKDGRKGPVLLDIAMDVFRADIEPETLEGFYSDDNAENLQEEKQFSILLKEIESSRKPIILLGNGLDRTSRIAEKVNLLKIPVVSTMLAVDFQCDLDCYFGFIGAYGDRIANFAIAKSDLVVAIGARLDVRQVGAKRENFAPSAKIIRIDIDKNELEYKCHSDEIGICADGKSAIEWISEQRIERDFSKWIDTCRYLKKELENIDDRYPNQIVRNLSRFIPPNVVLTTDVGQNQVWMAQSYIFKQGQRMLFSGGHGAMGYSLPAAIGAYYGTGNTVFSFNGDGGIQMNIQELQWISRERLPIKIFVFNNKSLGMIRHFQEMYFEKKYYQTVENKGFSSPNFKKIAKAYTIGYKKIAKIKDLEKLDFEEEYPEIIEIVINEATYVFPKLEFGKPNQDQEPLLDRELFKRLMEYGE